MATSTTNLGLIKPAGTDKIRIAQINQNMDVIDAKMGAVGNTPLQTQINNNLVHHKKPGSYTDNYFIGVVGFITSNGTRATLFLPLVFQGSIQTVSITSFLARIRTVECGYLGGSSGVDLASYITSATVQKAQGGISVILDNDDGWGISNNTPLCGEVISTLTLS